MERSAEGAEDGEEMKDAAPEDEEVPDAMAEGEAPPGVEDGSHAVGDTSGQKEDQADLGHIGDHRPEGEDEHPAHDKINGDHQFPESVEINAADDDAGEGHTPDDAEEDPAEGSPEGGEQDGGISSGDQQEDGGMVETGEDLFHPFVGKTVVKGGGGIAKYKGGSEDGKAYHMPDIATLCRKDNKYYQCGNAQGDTDPMGDAVDDLFGQGQFPAGCGHFFLHGHFCDMQI